MLSTKTLAAAGYTRNYFFGQDNYYTKDASKLGEAIDRSIWGGEGAKQLGLEGKVDPVLFEKLLAGELPNGERVGVEREGIWQHRPGFDLTFSAPKSFSMLMLMTEDDALSEAMGQMLIDSVKATMDNIEQDGACARKTENGQTVFEKTGNLTYAMHLHDISREGDPQSHIHTVVMNVTRRTDGMWRSLGSSVKKYGETVSGVEGFIEQVRSNKKYFGMRMRAELAHRVKAAGIDIVNKGNGHFEIAGISDRSMRLYSQRSVQIENYLKTHNLPDNAANRAMAAINTRKQKDHLPREQLASDWAERNQNAGGQPQREVDAITLAWEKGHAQHTSDQLTPSRDENVRERESIPSHEQKINREQAKEQLNADTPAPLDLPADQQSENQSAGELNPSSDHVPTSSEQMSVAPRTPIDTKTTHSLSAKAIAQLKSSMATLTRQQTHFSHTALVNHALANGIDDNLKIKDILNAVEALESRGELVILEANRQGTGMRYVTRDQLDAEKALLQTATFKLSAKAAISSNVTLREDLAFGQKLLATKAGVTIVDGVTLED